MQDKLDWQKILLVTLIWPVLQIVVFRMRFASVDLSMVYDSLVFLPLGLVSGLSLDFFQKKAESKRQRLAILLGFILSLPTAIFTSLLGGLVFHPLIGVTVFGIIPEIIGMGAGLLFAKRFDKIKKEES